jgi:thiamine-monophosphate kinase
MSEVAILRKLRRRVGAAGRGVVLGIGDDCAIFRPQQSTEDLVFTTDLLIEGIHFRGETHSPEDAGWKALARGLSDIAAMGAEPRFCLLSLALPLWTQGDWLDRFYSGLLALARRTRTVLAGGDLAHAREFACDIVVCGSVPKGQALRRDGARSGDKIYVSGALGGSALGLASRKGDAWQRHVRPEPRLALGRFLRTRATAAMDLSDGLSLDLHRLCLESGVAAALDGPLPVFHGASLEQALHGGEDYELLFTAHDKIPQFWHDIPLTRVGTILDGRPGAIKYAGRPLKPAGYDHFRKP